MSTAAAAQLDRAARMPCKVGLLIVDDYEVVRWGYRVIFGRLPWVTRCVTAGCGEQARALADRYDLRVALVDVFLGAEAGTDLARELSRTMRVLLVSPDGHASSTAFAASGAQGVVGKNWPTDRVVQSVRLAAGGRSLLKVRGPVEPSALLSRRETDVIALMATGATNSEIAQRLDVSPWTVKQHSSSLYRKLSVPNRAAAVSRAQQMSIID